MYSDIASVQILVSLLKQFGINRVVCSPGNRNVPIVHSLEQDPFFETYSVVDERSAAFFGIGLIQHFQTTVAICCTSGTAVCNYYSGIAEAFYQKLPLLIISADRNPYYLNQDEEQMLPQTAGFEKITKHIANLPIIKDEMDRYVCGRKINEALLELHHHGDGPVQINIPLESKIASFNTTELPYVPKISRFMLTASWNECARRLSKAKILILYGQASPLKAEELHELERFVKHYDAVLAVDPLANLSCEGSVSTFLLSRIINAEEFLENLCPDIVITLHGRYLSYIRNFLKNCNGKFEHWSINEAGQVVDPFSCISSIFECNAFEFIKKILSDIDKENVTKHPYKEMWDELTNQIDPNRLTLVWSDLLAVQMLLKNIPQDSKLHLANSSSVRLASNFSFPPAVEVFCNRGTNGIDGCMSSYVGMTQGQKELCYLLIGDLSFFYDMNALWNRYINANMRIILNNNNGATLFHYTVGVDQVPSLNQNIAAEHNATAKGWVESRGFRYISVKNKVEMQEAIALMANKTTNAPIFVEVFTDKQQDAIVLKDFYASLRKQLKLKSSSFIKRLFRG